MKTLSREMTEELKKFYKSRAKKLKDNLFDYDDDGNLIERNKEGTVIKTIPIPTYRKPTFEEIDQMEQKRLQDIAIANKEFEDARTALNDEFQKPNRLDSNLIRLNRKVMEADIKLQNIRFPLKYISKEDSIKIRQLNFSNPNETRVYPYPIAILKSSPFTLQEQYVRIGKEVRKPLISVAEAKNVKSTPVILFSEPDTNDYGFLSLNWAVQIEFNSTMYHSAKQALLAEIAKRFNDQNNLSKIMISESPNEITYSVQDVPGDKEINETKWNTFTKQLLYDVNLTKFNQYSELKARLLQTQNSILGAYQPNDNLIGIGISLDNINSKNPIYWTGQNLLGKALMEIRDKFRTEQELLQPSQPAKSIRRRRIIPSEQVESVVKPVESIVQPVKSVVRPVEPVVQPVEAVPVKPVRRRRIISTDLLEEKKE